MSTGRPADPADQLPASFGGETRVAVSRRNDPRMADVRPRVVGQSAGEFAADTARRASHHRSPTRERPGNCHNGNSAEAHRL